MQVRVGDKTYLLEGNLPFIGQTITKDFKLQAAIGNPVTTKDLFQGLFIVSTLPNIKKEHCIQQVQELETFARLLLPTSTQIIHVSSDPVAAWKNAKAFLPDVELRAYTLFDTDPESVAAFREEFGVGVMGSDRVAHGLFALFHGQFMKLQVPDDQLGVPNIPLFLREILDIKF